MAEILFGRLSKCGVAFGAGDALPGTPTKDPDVGLELELFLQIIILAVTMLTVLFNPFL